MKHIEDKLQKVMVPHQYQTKAENLSVQELVYFGSGADDDDDVGYPWPGMNKSRINPNHNADHLELAYATTQWTCTMNLVFMMKLPIPSYRW